MSEVKITGKMIEQAIREGHDQCDGHDCIHAEGAADALTAIRADVAAAMTTPESPLGAPVTVFYAGLHAGYRLAQIVAEKDAKRYDLHSASLPN